MIGRGQREEKAIITMLPWQPQTQVREDVKGQQRNETKNKVTELENLMAGFQLGLLTDKSSP